MNILKQLVALAFVASLPAAGQSWVPGDVVVSGDVVTCCNPFTSTGKVLLFDSAGVFKAELRSTLGTGFGQLSFGPDGMLYGTAGGVDRINPDGTAAHFTPINPLNIRSFTFNRQGELFATNSFDNTITKYSAAGAFQSSITPGGLSPFAIDLAADQCTLSVSGPSQLARYDICTQSLISLIDPGSGLPASVIRTFPDGSVLVNSPSFRRMRFDGSVVQSYAQPAALFTVASLNTAWIAGTNTISKMDLVTGATLIPPISTGLSNIYGIAVVGEVHAATVPPIPAMGALTLLILAGALAVGGYRALSH
jgi:hypothetical protein